METHGDDRNPKRDGGLLRNVYSYFGDPWNREIGIQFFDRYGHTGIGGRSMPRISWESPGDIQFASYDRLTEHEQDIMNYGWKISADGKTTGPFRNLRSLLEQADRMTVLISRGRVLSLPEPSPEDLTHARTLMAMKRRDPKTYQQALEKFHAENNIGVKNVQKQKAASTFERV